LIRALIFDFDGLILDTELPIFQSWQELYQEYGFQLSFETWSTIIGTANTDYNPLDELEKMLGRSLERENAASRRWQREMDLIAEQPVLPGVHQTLQDARRLGLKIGLASSSSCKWVTGHLSRLGLADFFDAILASDDVVRTKPDPALYREAAQALGVKPEQALALEDSPNGILAAKRAGLYCVAVPNFLTRRLPVNHADICLDSLADMPLEQLLQAIDGLSKEPGDRALGS